MKSRYDPARHHRRSIRLRGWDYAGSGVYFVTVCTYRRRCLFGNVVDGEIRLNPVGRLVDGIWRHNLTKRADVSLDAVQVMPNHVHAVIVMAGADRVEMAATGQDGTIPPGSLGAVVGNLKTVCTRRVNKMRGTPGAPLWQRNYWERIVRDEEELARIRTYIVSNPGLWTEDRLHVSDRGERIVD
ncbi:MAG: transposase [Anaerolineae bacterium]|nr:transposase [Anaerolineae bacterium]